MPPSGDRQIHDLLPYLSRPGQIFKFDNDDNTSVFLGEISDPNFPETCLQQEQAENYLKRIAQDENLRKGIYIARDEGAKIFMVTEKNHYYQIEFDEIELPHDIHWKYNDDLEPVLFDRLDERYQEQGGWLNPPPIRGAEPLILIPCLGEKFNECDILELLR